MRSTEDEDLSIGEINSGLDPIITADERNGDRSVAHTLRLIQTRLNQLSDNVNQTASHLGGWQPVPSHLSEEERRVARLERLANAFNPPLKAPLPGDWEAVAHISMKAESYPRQFSELLDSFEDLVKEICARIHGKLPSPAKCPDPAPTEPLTARVFQALHPEEAAQKAKDEEFAILAPYATEQYPHLSVDLAVAKVKMDHMKADDELKAQDEMRDVGEPGDAPQQLHRKKRLPRVPDQHQEQEQDQEFQQAVWGQNEWYECPSSQNMPARFGSRHGKRIEHVSEVHASEEHETEDNESIGSGTTLVAPNNTPFEGVEDNAEGGVRLLGSRPAALPSWPALHSPCASVVNMAQMLNNSNSSANDDVGAETSDDVTGDEGGVSLAASGVAALSVEDDDGTEEGTQ
ncbi:MAG: hypothetical protein Q9159_002649 [Coniocarpon cinnabarinum]